MGYRKHLKCPLGHDWSDDEKCYFHYRVNYKGNKSKHRKCAVCIKLGNRLLRLLYNALTSSS